MKKSIALLCTLVLCLTAVLTAAVHLNVRADGAAIELIEIESPVSFHSDLQKEVLEAGDFAAHLIRCGRYAVIIFVVIAVYPMIFKFTAKIGAKKSA